MSTQLIPVFAGEISGASTQLVDARLLHSFLESAQQFTDWIKTRIEEYGFIENIDFLLHKITKQKGRGGHNKIDYHLTLDMAKELSMVERNAKGRQARRYFIECERHALNAEKTKTENSQTQAATHAIPLNGTMIVEFKNGEAITCKPLNKNTWVFDAGNEPGVRKLVFAYIPADQLATLLDATMERMQAIAHGKAIKLGA